MNQSSEHINQDSSLRWNKTSAQQQTNSETLEQQKSNSWTPVGPTNDRSSGPSQLNRKLYAGAIIKYETRPSGVQLKRSEKLLTVTELTNKHAFDSFVTNDYFLNWSAVHRSRKLDDNCTQVTCHSSWKGGKYLQEPIPLGFHQCQLIAEND